MGRWPSRKRGPSSRPVAAARTVRRFPKALRYIERGEVHLCALYALRKHLTSDNVDELLREASGKSTREVEKMVAERFPRPDVPVCVEPVAPQAPLSPLSPVSVVATLSPMSAAAKHADAAAAWSLSLAAAPAPGPRPRIEPLSATRYRIELTVSANTKETIDRIKDLMRHRNPTGDLETILDASLALLLARLDKERLGTTSRPAGSRRSAAKPTNACASAASPHAGRAGIITRAPTAPVPGDATRADPAPTLPSEPATHDESGLAPVGPTHSQVMSGPGAANAKRNEAARAASMHAPKARRPRSRYVPIEVRRTVFARDGKQCTYVGPDGDRCPARGYLELDHVRPKAHRGTETAANLRVRCRAHNALYAEQVFGRAHVASRMDLRQRKRAPSTPASFETVSRGLRSLGFRELEARRALETLSTKPNMEAASIETILREALLVLT